MHTTIDFASDEVHFPFMFIIFCTRFSLHMPSHQSRGADMVLELVGSSAALRLAFDALRPMGNLSSVGVHTDQAFPFGPVDGYNKNIRYL